MILSWPCRTSERGGSVGSSLEWLPRNSVDFRGLAGLKMWLTVSPDNSGCQGFNLCTLMSLSADFLGFRGSGMFGVWLCYVVLAPLGVLSSLSVPCSGTAWWHPSMTHSCCSASRVYLQCGDSGLKFWEIFQSFLKRNFHSFPPSFLSFWNYY